MMIFNHLCMSMSGWYVKQMHEKIKAKFKWWFFQVQSSGTPGNLSFLQFILGIDLIFTMGKYYLYNKKAIFTMKSRASSHSLVNIIDKLA